jgi:hypothetical protein
MAIKLSVILSVLVIATVFLWVSEAKKVSRNSIENISLNLDKCSSKIFN